MKTKKKHLLIEIPKELHRMLKIRASISSITMRLYVLQAIAEKLKRDELDEK